jgi:hypothetical protein
MPPSIGVYFTISYCPLDRKILGKSFREKIKKFRRSRRERPSTLIVTTGIKFYWEVIMYGEGFKMGAI